MKYWPSKLPSPSVSALIVGLNLVTLLGIGVTLLITQPFQASVLATKIENLTIQAEIIGSALSDAVVEAEHDCTEALPTNAQIVDRFSRFPVNPELAAPVLRRLISPMEGRARIYDCDGRLVLDSDRLFSQDSLLAALQDSGDESLQETAEAEDEPSNQGWVESTFRFIAADRSLPKHQEFDDDEGLKYPDVAAAVEGETKVNQTLSTDLERVLTVSIPIRFEDKVISALQIAMPKGALDEVILQGWRPLVTVFFFAGLAFMLLSYAMSRIIARPLIRLALDAKRVTGTTNRGLAGNLRQSQPYTEVQSLSDNLNVMVAELYMRVDAIETFAADVAHELKNPLSSLRSAAETLTAATTDPNQTQLLEIIDNSSRRLNKLITEISNASRLDAELHKDDIEVVNLAALIKPFVDQEAYLTNSSMARLVLEMDEQCEERAIVLANAQKLAQVLDNLFSNAKSFAPPDSEITVRLQILAKREKVRVEVIDRGPGIPGNASTRVFERFYTDRPQATLANNNSGLGLTISRQIIEAYKGTIWAENRTAAKENGQMEIQGATFTFDLPLLPMPKKN